jgi:peptidoglycan hydrolase CwlO-like protein
MSRPKKIKPSKDIYSAAEHFDSYVVDYVDQALEKFVDKSIQTKQIIDDLTAEVSTLTHQNRDLQAEIDRRNANQEELKQMIRDYVESCGIKKP